MVEGQIYIEILEQENLANKCKVKDIFKIQRNRK